MVVEAMIVAAIIAELAPKAWNLIKQAEIIFPEAKMGKVKKQLIMDALLNDGFDIADKLTPGMDIKLVKPVVEKALSKLIDSAVTALNTYKYFDRVKLNPTDFGTAKAGQTCFIRTGMNLLIAAIFSVAMIITIFACGGTKVGTESLYSGPMTGTGETAIYVMGVCSEAQECAGGELLEEGLPNLEILGPNSTQVNCRGEVAGSCYNSESRTVILPMNPNGEAILTACLHDWLMQTTGDPDFQKTGEPWTRQCDKPFRIVE